ncbi:MAG TPA: carboxypeptidase-like regulatory domain-containing protein, partial [Pyrinomonadaceae bacterium]|nr:carboxypeptidase-like regulatory domain-containing protein [Pyrinomonadaceae bacterium]
MTTCRRITHLLPGVGVLCLLLAAFALPTYGQTNKGTIKGTVTDPNGGVVQNATVRVVNTGTNAERTVTTSDEGTYEAPLLDPGEYRVIVDAPTFSTATQENVVVQTASTQVVDIVLTVGGVGGTVTVTAAPTLVESETSERGGVVTGREVTELPLSGRNFTLLATLTPGVARASNAGFGGAGPDARQFNNGDPRAGSGGPGASNAQGDTPTARFARSGAGTLTVNGQRPTNNNFSLDGVDNNEPQFGTIGVFPNPDAIAEFKVTTSVPPAEVGRAAGAVINTTTKSGTN